MHDSRDSRPRIIARYDLRSDEERRGEGSGVSEARTCDRCTKEHFVVYEVESGQDRVLVGSGCAQKLLAGAGMTTHEAKSLLSAADLAQKTLDAARRAIPLLEARRTAECMETYRYIRTSRNEPERSPTTEVSQRLAFNRVRDSRVAELDKSLSACRALLRLPLEEVAAIDQSYQRKLRSGQLVIYDVPASLLSPSALTVGDMRPLRTDEVRLGW